MSDNDKLHIFGIRHHGPGSARSLRNALEKLQPDAILVEGPPDAADVLPLLINKEMKPPVALLIYRPDLPQEAVYYPFAVFSPEWQALEFGLKNNLPVRFMDLPQTHQMALAAKESVRENSTQETPENSETESKATESSADVEPEKTQVPETNPRRDPLGWIAEAAGYSDGERWWEHMVEHRRDDTDLFAAILEMMTSLREAVESDKAKRDEAEALRESYREAWMRQTIRQAIKEGYQKIAVICGAWHAPALATMPDAKADVTLLKNLPKVKVAATLVPWTYSRFSYSTGYGAGVESPGWYQHLWESPDRVAIRWMTRVAQLLRAADLDASSASVIEAVRLAEALAALRSRPIPGLPELNEATQSVLCFGDTTPMRLIFDKLIVGEGMGEVPNATPMVPLQQDLTREQKRLQKGNVFKVAPTPAPLELDLRKEIDLDRSLLLHRLALLGISWGQQQRVSGKSGTFHEDWQIQWQPEFAIKVIEAAIWGNTIPEASAAFVMDKAEHAPDLPSLTKLLDHTLLADLPAAVARLMQRIQAEAAIASDIAHLMDALPSLAGVMRYGNVRQTDTALVGQIVDGLVARICIGLGPACGSLDNEAAEAMFKRIGEVHEAILLLQKAELTEEWQKTLSRLTNIPNLHGLLAGRATRLLLMAGVLDNEAAATKLSLALSTASEPSQAAAWVEGFLRGSGLLLLHDEAMWQVLDEWVTTLQPDAFQTVLPLLRRTFATFAAPERRQMGERVKRGAVRTSSVAVAENDFDTARADAVLPLVAQLLGLEKIAAE